MIIGQARPTDMACPTKEGMEQPECVRSLPLRRQDDFTHQCSFSRYLWERTTKTFGVSINITRNDSVWSIIGHSGQLNSNNKILVVSICSNTWEERNNIIFNSIVHSPYIYLQLIAHDFTLWIGIPSNEQRA